MNPRFLDFIRRFRELERKNAGQGTSRSSEPIARHADAPVRSLPLMMDPRIWSPDSPLTD